MSQTEEKPTVTVDHPVPKLEVLDLETGDVVIYDPDEKDAYIQIDDQEVWELDGRWR